MDLKELETFIMVAELKSFSKTADFLNVTQPTITNHIQSLESVLDTKLINRKGKHLSLTNSGEILYRYAIDILNSCQMAKFDLKSHQEKISGHLNIIGSDIARRHLLPEVITSFIAENQDVTFSIMRSESSDSIEDIENRKIDFAFVSYEDKSFKDIEFLPIFEEEVIIIIPNSLPFTNYSVVDYNVFSDYKMFSKRYEPEIKDHFLQTFEDSGFPTDNIYISGRAADVSTIKELVSLGAGAGLIPKIDAEKDLPLGKYKIVYLKDISLKQKVYFAYPKNRHLTPINEIFKNFFLEYYDKKLKNKK